MRHFFSIKFLHFFIITSIISISSLSQAASVSFSWTPNTEINLAGYNIYYGTSSGSYSSVTKVGLPEIVDNKVSTTLNDFSEGTIYYFAATAYDIDGFESNYSQEIQWTVPIDQTQYNPEINFTDDNSADILFRNNDTGLILLYLIDDAGTPPENKLFPDISLNWHIIGLKDFNGDNKTDILTRNSLTGEIWLYQMEADIITVDSFVATVPLEWDIADLEDFNGDNKADILFRNSITGEIWLYQMNGNIVVASNSVGTAPLEWDIADLEDFNGDNKADILFRNSITGQIWLYQMNGNIVVASNPVETPPLEWNIANLDDFNGDNNADILFRNSSTGEIWFYQMDGDMVIDSSLVIDVDLDWNMF